MPAFFDFEPGASTGTLPSGVTISRPAGPWSRGKRLEYTDFRFADGVLPAGAGVTRAAGPWSRRGESGALVKGTAANVARFDYDPPVENLVSNSAVTNSLFPAGGASMSTTEQSGGITKYEVGAVGPGTQAVEYLSPTMTYSTPSIYSVDLRGNAGGEVIFIAAFDAGGATVVQKRIVLSTSFQRYELPMPTGSPYYIGFGNRYANSNEATPAQTYYARRRQLNRGPVALAYAETTGAPIYVPPVCKGAYLEPERANIAINSEQIANGSGWSYIDADIVTLDVASAPDGTLTADRLKMSSAAGSIYNTTSGASALNGETYTASTFARSIAASCLFRIAQGTPGVADYTPSGNFTLSPTYTRISLTNTNTGNGTGSQRLYYRNGTDGSTDIYVWGAQLERGAVASSYIPTTTAAATRPAESFTFDVSRGGATGAVLLTYADGSTETRNGTIAAGVLTLPASSTPRVVANARVLGMASTVLELGTAANVPRYAYSDAGLFQGLLVEPQRTNSFLNSSAVFSAQSVTTQNDVAVAPDGTTTADRITEAAVSDNHYSYSNFNFGSATPRYAYSAYLKAAGRNYAGLDIYSDVDKFISAFADLTTGAILKSLGGTSSTFNVADSKVAGGGYARLSVIGVINATGLYPSIYLVNSASANISANYGLSAYQGDASASVLAWGQQLEVVGAGELNAATSYIPTTNGAATRPAETVTVNWGAQSIPDGTIRPVFVFGDDSMVIIDTVVAGGTSTLPTNFGKPVKRIAYNPAVTPPGRTTSASEVGSRIVTR